MKKVYCKDCKYCNASVWFGISCREPHTVIISDDFYSDYSELEVNTPEEKNMRNDCKWFEEKSI